MRHYKLFIDETGHPHKNHHSTHFALVGIIIEDHKQEVLKTNADLIKFKYWDRTNVVFHSEEIGKKVGDYTIFAQDINSAKKFEKQLLHFLNTCPIHVVAAVVDKKKAYRVGWKEETIVTKAGESLVMDFLAFLYGQGDAQGRIVYETSGSTRDNLYLKAFHRYLDPGWEQKHPEYMNVREHITSITFASKLNHDTEMQIADIFSYAATCHNKLINKLVTFDSGSYEKKLLDALNKKKLSVPVGITDKKKKKYYSQINGLAFYPSNMSRKKKKTA